jgi:hypothetical protein
MNKSLVRLFLGGALLFAAHASAQTFTLSNIQEVIGSGPNEAAFVVSWNDGKTPDSLVWGYRWSGTAPTVFGMMQAVEAADSRFSFTDNPEFAGQSVFSVYYDLTGKGGTPSVGTPALFEGAPDTETGTPPVPGDHYAEGWFYNGFWGELIGIGNPYNGGSWDTSYPDVQGVGIDTLTNNGWYGLSFSTDLVNFNIPNPAFPTAVTPAPEPSALCFLSLGTVGLLARRKRRRS